MAYGIASDKLFAKHLSDVVKRGDLGAQRPASATSGADDEGSAQINDSGFEAQETSQLGTAAAASHGAETDPSRDFTMTSGRASSDSESRLSTESLRLAEPEEDATSPQGLGGRGHDNGAESIRPDPRLRRVSIAVLQRTKLGDEVEEAALWRVQHHWEKMFIERPTGFDKHVYLVLDGLDERDETEAVALCTAINASSGASPECAAPKVHKLLLMNTERVSVFKSEILTNATVVRIDHEVNTADVKMFIRSRIKSAWEKKLVCQRLRQAAREAIMLKSECNFLRASLLVDEVPSLTREDAIRSRLSDLPGTTEAAMLLVIERLARKLDGHHREYFHVSLISYAKSEMRNFLIQNRTFLHGWFALIEISA